MKLADIGIHKNIKIFQACLYIVLVFCSILIAEEKEDVPALAILVYCDGGNQELADKLQPLLEAEAGLQWDGTLVERAKIDKLLDEMKLTRSGISDPNTQLLFGKMIPMDCLLTVRVNKDSVKSTLSHFPSTTIIHEKEYTERLEPQSLSVNIVTNAMKSYREHNRDPHKPQISIASFCGKHLSKGYFDFGRDINKELRKKLIENKTIILMERLLPSDLLNEFELARGGLTQCIAQNLSAPPSDILIYGEFKAKPEQDLTKPAAELDFTLFLVSPTGLCESKKTEFSCYSNQPEVAAEKALELIEQASNEIKIKLVSGQKRVFSEKEFEEFKNQAFRFMPNPPSEVFYNNYQFGGFNELESASRMLECAMFFKGNDIKLLTCSAMVLYSMYRESKNNAKEECLTASREIIKRAYMLESNKNTRDCYCRIFVVNPTTEPLPPGYLDAAKHIWNTRDSEKWELANVFNAIQRILEAEIDTQQLSQFFLYAAQEYEDSDEDMLLFSALLEAAKSQLSQNKKNPKILQLITNCSNSLINENNDYLRWVGYNLYLLTSYNNENDIPAEYINYFHDALNLIGKIQKKKDGLLIFQHLEFGFFFQEYDKAIKQYNLKDNSAELKEKYIAIMYKLSGYAEIATGGVFNSLLNQLWEQGEYKKGYDIISEYIDQQKVSLEDNIKKRIKFYNAMNNKNQLSTNDLEKINMNSVPGNITNFVPLNNYILGITYYSIHQIYPNEKKVTLLKNIPDGIYDLSHVGKYIGIATQNNGFYLLNVEDNKLQHFTPDNSSFPGKKITDVRESGNKFLVSIKDENVTSDPRTFVIEPETAQIISLAFGKLPEILKPIKKFNLKKTPHINLYMNRIGTGLTITDSKENLLMQYSGAELTSLNDIELWQGYLIFAMNYGLFISTPGSNIVRSFIIKDNLKFNCLCTFNNELFIGTSNGLYSISADKFLEMVNNLEEK
jgi:hypothetical protein